MSDDPGSPQVGDTMMAWRVTRPGPMSTKPLQFGAVPRPRPGPEELLVEVSTCGVCRTDLHVTEGDLPVHREAVIPGHEIVGRVIDRGAGATEFSLGDRVGIAWLARTCEACRFCRSGRENLCLAPRFTGWDLDGGYAPYAVVHAAYAYSIPDEFDDRTAAPLLCAGIIGYRALERAQLPTSGTLGIYGFGASAHLAAQIALHRGATVHVMTRSEAAQRLALELGCHSATGATDPPPEPLDSAILFAPVGRLVPPAMEALDRGGSLAIAGIHLSDIPVLEYQRHLFQEKQIRSVTANTRADGRAFFRESVAAGVQVRTTPYPIADADRALEDLAADRVDGAAVLLVEH